MQKSIDDCYFFYYSTCSKNEYCPFRHCEKALGTEVVCKNWLNNTCVDFNCPLRHMHITKNRAQIPCYWESTPSGCQKSFCPFFHRTQPNDKPPIIPDSTQKTPTTTADAASNYSRVVVNNSSHSIASSNTGSTNQLIQQETNGGGGGGGITTNKPFNFQQQDNEASIFSVSPVIVQMNEDDESDNEDALEQSYSTSKKENTIAKRLGVSNLVDTTKKRKVVSIKKTITEEPQLKLAVKSLEEIKKEKEALKKLELGTSAQASTVAEMRTEKRFVRFSDEVEEEEKIISHTSTRLPTEQHKTTAIGTSLAAAEVANARLKKRREKNLINLISNTIAENSQVSLNTQINAISSTTQVPVVTARKQHQQQQQQKQQQSVDNLSIKIKTYDEIKAEKELKQKVLEESTTKKLPEITVLPIVSQATEILEIDNKTLIKETPTSIATNSTTLTRKLKLIKKPSEEKLSNLENLNNKTDMITTTIEKPIKLLDTNLNNQKRKLEVINKTATATATATSTSEILASKVTTLKSINNDLSVASLSSDFKNFKDESDESKSKKFKQNEIVTSIDINERHVDDVKLNNKFSLSDFDEINIASSTNSLINARIQLKQAISANDNDIDKELNELMMLCSDEDDVL